LRRLTRRCGSSGDKLPTTIVDPPPTTPASASPTQTAAPSNPHRRQTTRPALNSDENLHFLSIPPNDKLLASYTPASLGTDDYPDLIDPGQPVSTVAVGNVLAVYNWPAGTERYRKVARFVHAFFDRLHDLQSPPYHPKWREIDVAVPVERPGSTPMALPATLESTTVTPDEEQRNWARGSATPCSPSLSITRNGRPMHRTARECSTHCSATLCSQSSSMIRNGRPTRRAARECSTRGSATLCSRS
jgi:hypothetical protein